MWIAPPWPWVPAHGPQRAAAPRASQDRPYCDGKAEKHMHCQVIDIGLATEQGKEKTILGTRKPIVSSFWSSGAGAQAVHRGGVGLRGCGTSRVRAGLPPASLSGRRTGDPLRSSIECVASGVRWAYACEGAHWHGEQGRGGESRAAVSTGRMGKCSMGVHHTAPDMWQSDLRDLQHASGIPSEE